MAQISLRSYQREIEGLIENGQVDEAIAHCRYILESFPKNVDTYRIMGKAYLEAQRYGDAADIFERVLSAVPDDFIAHLGMSVIREDEADLDEAIWHMERAFEIQPANTTIQDELRRLLRKRDGIEPAKIRLTRGALARMYFKGELHQQAIAELRAALAEDPSRLDLQTLLARVYLSSRQKAEAVETANAVLKKLPYCLEANRVMAQALAESDRLEEAKTYQERLLAMDAYTPPLSERGGRPVKTPDHAVSLERYDWRPGQAAGATPSQMEWAASLGVNVQDLKQEEEAIPEWLTSPETPSLFPEPELIATEEDAPVSTPMENEWGGEPWVETGPAHLSASELEEPAPESEIPDWIKEHGWMPATAPESESIAESPLEAGEEVIPSAAVEADEIPAWLLDLNPEEEEEEAEETPVPLLKTEEAAEPLEWLEEEPAAAPQGPLASQHAEPEAEPALPEWLLAETPVGSPGASGTTELEETELPDWLKGIEEKAEEIEAEVAGPEGEPTPAFGLAEATLPAGSDELLAEMSSEGEIPDWLRDSLQEEDVFVEEFVEAPGEAAAIEPAAPAVEESEIAAEPAHAAEVPDWLKELEEEPIIEGDTKPTRPVPAVEMPLPVEPAVAPEEFPWTAQLEGTFQEGSQGSGLEEKLSPEAAAVEELPDWLKALQAETDEEAQPAEAVLEPIPGMEAIEELPAPLPETAAPPEPSLETLDTDAAFAWLESLAVKQGAEEALLLSEEERLESPPDWVIESMSKDEAAETQVSALPEAPPDEEDFLASEEALAEEEEIPTEAIAELVEELPTPEFAMVEPSIIQEELPPAAPVEPLHEENVPAWLDTIEEEIEAESAVLPVETWLEEAPAAPVAEVDGGAVIVESAEEAFGPMPVEQPAPSAAAEEAQLAEWLESLPVETGEEAWAPPVELEQESARLQLDLNKASLSELERLPGIGFILAQQIVTQRETKGPFTALEDLLSVPGFSEATLEQVKESLRVVEKTAPAAQIGEEEIRLITARNSLIEGKLAEALAQYNDLISQRQYLAEIIRDLKDATYRFPVEYEIWQAIGDAYFQSDQIQEALDAYTRAEELLK